MPTRTAVQDRQGPRDFHTSACLFAAPKDYDLAEWNSLFLSFVVSLDSSFFYIDEYIVFNRYQYVPHTTTIARLNMTIHKDNWYKESKSRIGGIQTSGENHHGRGRICVTNGDILGTHLPQITAAEPAQMQSWSRWPQTGMAFRAGIVAFRFIVLCPLSNVVTRITTATKGWGRAA